MIGVKGSKPPVRRCWASFLAARISWARGLALGLAQILSIFTIEFTAAEGAWGVSPFFWAKLRELLV